MFCQANVPFLYPFKTITKYWLTIYNQIYIYTYIYIYKFTSGCHRQTTPSSEWIYIWQCVRSIANDRSILIKKADKGSCVVVWDSEGYIAEASKQLNDDSVYKSVKFKDKILKDIA